MFFCYLAGDPLPNKSSTTTPDGASPPSGPKNTAPAPPGSPREKKRSKNKSSRTKKQNPRHKQAYCTCLCGIIQLQAREPRKRDEAVPATPKPKRRQNKQKATTQPSDTGPLGTRWRQAARKLRTTQCAIDAGVVRTVGMDSFLAWARVSPPAS